MKSAKKRRRQDATNGMYCSRRAFAAQAEAQVADRLTAVAGSCGPGSLHFINGIFEANRNRAPVILIASQIIRDELGFDFIQEVDFKQGLQRLLRHDPYAGTGAPEDVANQDCRL
jgi:TPP-dependent trihydroxycyclohexane-1,2-dione (THcHDO) dehydratase